MMKSNPNSRPLKTGQWLMLCVLFLGLTFTCSDLNQRVVYRPVGAFELAFTDEFPRLVTSDPADEEKKSEDLLIAAIYQKVRYPKEARAAGATGMFNVTVMVEADGSAKVTNVCSITPDKLDPNRSLVVTGFGKKAEGVIPSEEELFLINEAYEIIDGIGPFEPGTHEGEAHRSLINFDLVFNLEEG